MSSAAPHPIVAALRAERLRRGWTVRQVERHTGLSRSNIGGWERGEITPTLASAAKYAEALGRPLQLAPDNSAALAAVVELRKTLRTNHAFVLLDLIEQALKGES